jgi:hypothetical protein
MRRLSTVLVVFCVIGVASGARADIAISIPSGLSPGDQFRIIFATDATRDATSSAIGDYNNFVTNDAMNEAGGGSVLYNGSPLSWDAVASTEAMSAISNIGSYGVPVFLSSGTEVAGSDTSSANGLWSGSLYSAPTTDLLGHPTATGGVWTGTDPNGQIHLGAALGDTDPIFGLALPDPRWIDLTQDFHTATYHLYGISDVLTVPATTPATPEAASIWIWGMLACCGAAGAFVQRRRVATLLR